MQIEEIDSDTLVVKGDVYESLATAFIRNGDVLLVDTLASRSDAEWLRRQLEDELGKKVRVIVSTHYMNHMALRCADRGAAVHMHTVPVPSGIVPRRTMRISFLQPACSGTR